MQIHRKKFPISKSAYGGSLQTTRSGRKGPRPLSFKYSMHLVLRSSKARDKKSFRHFRKPIENTLEKFSVKFGVQIIRYANNNNHLHLHLKLTSRNGYKAFIRAVTSAIAMKVGGHARWQSNAATKFWDRRPFSRITESFRDLRNMHRYILINQLEGMGFNRFNAEVLVWSDFRKNRRLLGYLPAD